MPSRCLIVGLLSLAFLSLVGRADSAPQRVGVYRDEGGQWTLQQVDQITDQLRSLGLEVVGLEAGELIDATVVTPQRLDLLVICGAVRAPAEALNTIARFSRQGGKLMLLGGPYFQQATWPYGDRWLDRDALQRAVLQDMRPSVVFDFDVDADFGGQALNTWRHHTDTPDNRSTASLVAPGAAGSAKSLHLALDKVTGWDTYQSPPLERPFAGGETLTTFWAKADANTPQLSLEWRERDGSRWIAVVELTQRWTQYALSPGEFKAWTHPPVPGRGRSGDSFRPENAATITIGLAHSHTQITSDGPHEICFDQLAAAAVPETLGDSGRLLWETTQTPRIPTVAPGYKLYGVTNLARLRATPGQAIAGPLEAPTPKGVFAPHVRPQGTGLEKGRRLRYVPLLECLDQRDRVCGSAATLAIVGPNAGDGGLILGVSVADPEFFADRAVAQWLGNLAGRMLQGVFLYEGGAKYYASFGDERMPVGALVSNRGHHTVYADVDAQVIDGDESVVWSKSFEVEVAAGESSRVEADWTIGPDAAGPFTVAVSLRREGREIDRLEHQVRVWRPKAKPSFLAAQKGDFYLGDAKWYAHGVNYMPSSGVAIEDQAYFEYWLDPRPYDPDVIERDLADLEEIGLNLVSAFVYDRSLESRNLLDFLMRCEDHHLKVNLSLRPGTPLNFRWDEVRALIETNRLAQNDTIIAYDLAWEPLWGRRDRRRKWDGAWSDWIASKYDTIEAAEHAWGVSAVRENGQVAGPDDRQVSSDGPWREMVVDYRRFLNELLHERYDRARGLVRSIDPNHLVGFRMTVAGDPTVSQANLPYDMAGLAAAVDLMEPEGYGRIGDWERVRPGWFTVAYARAVAPELPVVWGEFGYSVWGQSAGRVDSARLEFAARFYEDFYRMAYQSGSNGTIAWFSAAGYRFNEKSDYGIQNPDRSWRESTRVMNRWSARMTEPRRRAEVDVWIPIQLQRDAAGIAGIYERVEESFWNAVESGKTPGLKVVE